MKSERTSNIELLRIILMFMIVLLHVSDWLVLNSVTGDLKVYLIAQSLIPTLCICAVNTFVFVSGFYGITQKAKPFITLIATALSTSWIISGLAFLLGYTSSISEIVAYVFPISFSTWWFLTVYVILYIISPFINKGFECLSKRHITVILFLLILFDLTPLISNNIHIHWC